MNAFPFPTVVLLHERPKDTHFDWLLATHPPPYEPEERCLLSFRLDRRPGHDSGAMQAVRLPNHRAQYLTYEGSLGAGRGRVERVDEGRCELEFLGCDEIRIAGALGQVGFRASARRSSVDGAWLIEMSAPDRSRR